MESSGGSGRGSPPVKPLAHTDNCSLIRPARSSRKARRRLTPQPPLQRRWTRHAGAPAARPARREPSPRLAG
eukprot:8131593-Alexandrium_andersonii.AAC.1